MIRMSRIRALIRHFESVPSDQIEQGVWCRVQKDLTFEKQSLANEIRCGKAACIAGWTVLKWGDPRWTIKNYGKGAPHSYLFDENGNMMEWDVVASKLLGLKPKKAKYVTPPLFRSNDTTQSDRDIILLRLKDILKNGEKSVYV